MLALPHSIWLKCNCTIDEKALGPLGGAGQAMQESAQKVAEDRGVVPEFCMCLGEFSLCYR
jgi:hypothetical protein